MDNEEQSGMEFFIYFLIFIAVIGLLTTIYLYEYKTTAYNSPKPEVMEKVTDPPVVLNYSGTFVRYDEQCITPKVTKKIAHPCDPAEIGCGVTYYHDGVPSKE